MIPITRKPALEQVDPPRSPRETLPTMYDLPSENPEEPGLPDEFHDLQPQLLSRTLQLSRYTRDNCFTARRILSGHRLKPWRHHLWLSPRVPRDTAFAKSIQEISTLYTRPLSPNEMVLCVDEKTSLQPRPRTAKTLPAQPGVPVRVENEYERQGALNLFAAFDTRTGFVWGQTYERKRQEEFMGFLEYLDRQIPSHITTIHLVLDNLSVHKGKKVQAWLTQHPRFVFYYSPVHCSWMNQVEQWFSILQLEFRLRWQGAPGREAVMTAKKFVKFASANRE